jgi:drug/metabolite transporter (DMT)-like permease
MAWGAVFIVLVSGTVAAIGSKCAYQLKVAGQDGDVHAFTKAYLFTGLMFIGEFICLGWYYFSRWYNSRNVSSEYSALSDNTKAVGIVSSSNHLHATLIAPGRDEESLQAEKLPKPPLWTFAVLSMVDLTSSTISGIGQIWVSASTLQMLRGSAVLFTGICSMLILKSKLTRGQWSGIGIVIVALAIVGASSELRAENSPKKSGGSDATSGQVLAGIILILLGSLGNSIQGVFEEKLLKGQGYAEVDALEVVGWEGCFGTLVSFFVMLPIVAHVTGDDYGHVQENTIDSLIQLSNSPVLIVLCISYVLSLSLLNNYMQVISKELSAIIRQLVSTCRVVVVWAVGLILYHFDTDLGESWDKWSYMQLGAFVVLVSGTLLYVQSRAPPAPAADETTVLTKSLNNNVMANSQL